MTPEKSEGGRDHTAVLLAEVLEMIGASDVPSDDLTVQQREQKAINESWTKIIEELEK